MKSFLTLNRHKLLFAFKFISILFFSILILISIAIRILKGDNTDIKQIAIIILVSSVSFSIFILGIAYHEWLLKRKVRVKGFKRVPFNQLENIGFEESFINVKTKWYFTEEIKEMDINGYLINCDIKKEAPKIVEFKTFTVPKVLEDNEVLRLRLKFNNNNIVFNNDSFVKEYKLNDTFNTTIDQLKTELQEFIDIIKSEGFMPNLNNDGIKI